MPTRNHRKRRENNEHEHVDIQRHIRGDTLRILHEVQVKSGAK